MRKTVLAALAAGLIGALAVTGCAAQSAASARPAAAPAGTRTGTGTGTVRTCAAFAYQAIQRHETAVLLVLLAAIGAG